MKIRLLILVVFATAILSSCSSGKESLVYFNDITGVESGVLSQVGKEITIKPDDELLITISSEVPEATAAYNVPLINPALAKQLKMPTQPQPQTYIVSSKGNIDMPVLGKLHVEGLTTDQLADELFNRVSKDVQDPYIRVEMLNFKVNVLGEVAKPGIIEKPVADDTFTILQALASSGDMTEYSDRSNVMVLRKENGQIVYHRMNLNDSKSIESPYFFLQQGDVVIVPPSKSRESNAKYDSNNSFKIQIVSTIVSAVSVLASLVIALAVK